MPRHEQRRAGDSREGESKRPVFDCRAGRVKAAVWENDGRRGVFPTVTFSRSYKDDDKWKSATSFNVWDLADLARCAFSAEAYCRANYPSQDDSSEEGQKRRGAVC